MVNHDQLLMQGPKSSFGRRSSIKSTFWWLFNEVNKEGSGFGSLKIDAAHFAWSDMGLV